MIRTSFGVGLVVEGKGPDLFGPLPAVEGAVTEHLAIFVLILTNIRCKKVVVKHWVIALLAKEFGTTQRMVRSIVFYACLQGKIRVQISFWWCSSKRRSVPSFNIILLHTKPHMALHRGMSGNLKTVGIENY